MLKLARFYFILHFLTNSLFGWSSVLGIDPSYEDLNYVKSQIQNMKIDKVVFDSFEDAKLMRKIQRKGLLIRRENPIGTVLVCHGYLSNKHDAIYFKHLFPRFNVMSFDFRAHGENSQGQFSTVGRDEAFDVMGAVQFIKSDPSMKTMPLIAYGFSMGAVAAIEAQSQDSSLFDAMILDCPYDSTDDGMRRGLQEKMNINILGRKVDLPGTEFIVSNMYNENYQSFARLIFQMVTGLNPHKVPTRFVRVEPVNSVKHISCPCFFIHCESDQKIPVKAVQRLYTNTPGFKRLWITKGRKHFGSYIDHPEMYWYMVNKFIKKVFDGNLDQRTGSKIYDDRAIITNA